MQSVAHRFWKRVDRGGADECWAWLGGRYINGYGAFFLGSRNVRAHRVAWSLANGRDFPSDKVACHSCDNRWCVNPSHIWVGTQADNIADMVQKGRANFGGGRRGRKFPRTHCKRGHPYEGQKTHPSDTNRSGRCQICQKMMRALREGKAVSK